MKKFLLSAAALMAAMTMNAQEVCVFNADNAMGLDSENGTAVAAGTVIGETASIVAKVGGDDTYKPQSATFTVNGTDITGGLQGGTNPKDADGLVPATSLQPAAAGAFLVFEAKADGYLYVMHKASSNKAYTVFEEGTCISYTFTAIGSADSELGAVYSYTLPYVVENEQFVVKNPVEWAEQEFLKATNPEAYAAHWKEETADDGTVKQTWDNPIKINGLGVIKFPVYKDCKYIVNANGSKITAAGFAFSTADDVAITSDGIALNGEGGGSQGGETVLYENDFTGITEFTGWSQFDDSQTDGKVEVDPDGVAITVGIQTGQLWQPQVMVVPDGSFNLKEDGNYKVFVTAKFPSDGTLQINMGTWSANDQAQFPVTATGDFQTVECDFEGWSVDAEGAHLLFQCGDFKGTTILKSIKIVEIGEGGDEPEPEAHIYGVVGTLVDSWDIDVDMVLGEGGLYVCNVENVAAGDYEFKIRQDHDWTVNWGSDFKQDGPNCKVSVAEDGSTVSITFDPETGVITWEVIAPEPAGEVLLYENDFTGITEFTGWSQFDDSQTDGKVEVNADGVAITVGIQTGQLWQPQVMIVPDGSFNLAEDGDYKVVVTAKFPTDGTLQINMGTWSANDQAQFPVTATGDFQEVVCEFPGWSVDAEGAHLLFQCGDFKGTTIVKKIQIFQLGSTGINGVKTITPATGAIYNLKGQKVDASYKGIVIMNGKKYLQK